MDQLVARVHGFFNAFNNHDANGIGEFLTEDFRRIGPEGLVVSPREPYLNRIQDRFDVLPDMHNEPVRISRSDDGRTVTVETVETFTVGGETFSSPTVWIIDVDDSSQFSTIRIYQAIADLDQAARLRANLHDALAARAADDGATA